MKIFAQYLLFFIIITTSCTKNDAIKSSIQPEETKLNVSYGSDSSQRMDVYLPAGRSTDSTKVMVFIHGGAWSDGDKKDFNPYVAILKSRLPQYAIFNINYRLANQVANHFPSQEEDVKAAIDYIIKNKDEFGISEKLFLLGASAGGHLALLHAYKYTEPVKVKAVISLFGPTDLADMYYHPLNPYIPFALKILLEGTPVSNASAYTASSPLNFVSGTSIPTLLFHGTADPLVKPSQSINLYNKLQAAGVASEIKIYEGEGHGWSGAILEDTFNKIVSFLNKTAK